MIKYTKATKNQLLKSMSMKFFVVQMKEVLSAWMHRSVITVILTFDLFNLSTSNLDDYLSLDLE